MRADTAGKSDGLNGILPVDKPRGITSHDVVDRVRRILRLRKIGHTGTLDPQAQGLLLLCVGGATRFAGYLTGQDKSYRAAMTLGVSTTTDDTEGEVVSRYEGALDDLLTTESIEDALASFKGISRQVPPDFSSKKLKGTPAYVMARRGEKPRLRPVNVRIDSIRLISIELPELNIELRCSSGTYVRSIARDLGARLDCGGHLASLVRTSIGEFTLDEAFTLDQLKEAGADRIERHMLMPVEKALKSMPAVVLCDEARDKIYYGRQVDLEGCEVVSGPGLEERHGPFEARMHDRGTDRFLGIGTVVQNGGTGGGSLRPKRLMVEAF